EDGIRDDTVTGVQTCALPIYRNGAGQLMPFPARVARCGSNTFALLPRATSYDPRPPPALWKSCSASTCRVRGIRSRSARFMSISSQERRVGKDGILVWSRLDA